MMDFIKLFGFFLLVLFCWTSCEEPATTKPPTEITSQPDAVTTTTTIAKKSPPSKDCEITSRILDGNRKLVKDQNTLVCIVADDTTKDKELGDSHRILEVYNTGNCELIYKKILPVNSSPDFPYTIADIIYNKNSNLIAIKGYASVFCYDVKNQKMLEELIPDFLNERIAADAQSGQIKHLEVWENYLIGYCNDIGAFAFDLTDIKTPKVLLPSAEYDLSDGEGEDFSSLFFLKSENENTFQAIAPNYDYDENKFNVNVLFDVPKKMNVNLPKSRSNNRFVVLKTQDKSTFAIDMKSQKKVDLSDDIKGKTTAEILKWLEK